MNRLVNNRLGFDSKIRASLGGAIRGKGGTVNDTDSWDTMVSAVGTLANVGNKSWANGNMNSDSSMGYNFSGLAFAPSMIIIYQSNSEFYITFSSKKSGVDPNGTDNVTGACLYNSTYGANRFSLTSNGWTGTVLRATVNYKWLAIA
ncbi:hypothetical protein [Neobacillus niacini]|uniref:hypothetical protein n=1 Tax=Neobacillus niacini TaxID=86668 RepID=UPI0028542AD7|nr:hypothetical protein [Neobacillus niacini]MDR7001549.1 hypothetical protein [Neobacillus niacini]